MGVEYIQEFEWKIEGDNFKEFMALSTQKIGGTEYKGPSFECICSNHENGKEEKILIRPQIYRIVNSFPQYSSVGMSIESVPSGQGIDFWWSASVKEVGYYSGREYAVFNKEEDEYESVRAFKNKKLNKIDGFTLMIYVRTGGSS